jgi:hypothetical protein
VVDDWLPIDDNADEDVVVAALDEQLQPASWSMMAENNISAKTTAIIFFLYFISSMYDLSSK